MPTLLSVLICNRSRIDLHVVSNVNIHLHILNNLPFVFVHVKHQSSKLCQKHIQFIIKPVYYFGDR